MTVVHSSVAGGDRLIGNEVYANLTSLLSKSSIMIEGNCCTFLLFGILLYALGGLKNNAGYFD